MKFPQIANNNIPWNLSRPGSGNENVYKENEELKITMKNYFYKGFCLDQEDFFADFTGEVMAYHVKVILFWHFLLDIVR